MTALRVRPIAALFLSLALLAPSLAVALDIKATNDATTLYKALLGGAGITVSSATYSGAATASGTYTKGPLGIADGIIMTSGGAALALPPNDQEGATQENNLPGDPLCAGIVPGHETFDAARLNVKFKIDPSFAGVTVSFIVGSEEYPEFVGQNFNDVVAVFVDGKNIALDAKGNPITINGPFFSGTSVIKDNGTQYDGTTPRLEAHAPLPDAATEHTLVVVVCDAGDQALDTGLFIAALGGCKGDCSKPAAVTWCGDGVVQGPDEKCDDGNNVAGDGCDNACQPETAASVCGDGTKADDEACDDGNTADGDGCSAKCEIEAAVDLCGDGTVTGAEQCDDGNTTDGDGCSAKCETEAAADVCGDGKKTGNEQCDDGNATDGDGCSAKCETEAAADKCGDGNKTGAEQCDDGNTTDGDGCSAACKTETAPVDTDKDGIVDDKDNCPTVANPDQKDWDGNAVGDACQDEDILVTGGACSAQSVGGSGASLALLLLVLAALLFARQRRSRIGVGTLALLVLLPVVGQAAQLDVQTFHPSPFMHDLLAAEKGAAAGNHPWNIGLIGNYQLNPLVLRTKGSDDDKILRDIVHHQVTANLLAGVRIFNWLSVGIDVPVVPYQAGEAFGPFDDPATFALGDVRLNPRIRLLSNEDGSFNLAATAQISAPTGKLTDDYTGRSGFAFNPGLLASVDWGRFGLAVDMTVLVAGEDEYANLKMSHAINARAGLWVVAVPEKFDLLIEATGATQLLDLFGAVEESPLELVAAGKWHVKPSLDVVFGAGTGLTSGAGSPDLRVIAGLMYGPVDAKKVAAAAPPLAPAPPKDSDGDGIVDDKDKCPNEAEDKDNFQDEDGCPDPDNDGDNISDTLDRCPTEAEDMDGFEDDDGCPDADNDVDKICDPWVSEKGLHPKYAEICKGIDKCPTEPETRNSFEDDDGCPDQAVKVDKKEVIILQQVLFYYDKTRIKEESFPLLDEVVTVLKEHPELRKLRVEGHTDERGNPAYNLKLSGGRAKAVVDYLIEHGVEGKRLISKGYGKRKPVVKNAKTDAEHLANRRVQFVILKKDK